MLTERRRRGFFRELARRLTGVRISICDSTYPPLNCDARLTLHQTHQHGLLLRRVDIFDAWRRQGKRGYEQQDARTDDAEKDAIHLIHRRRRRWATLKCANVIFAMHFDHPFLVGTKRWQMMEAATAKFKASRAPNVSSNKAMRALLPGSTLETNVGFATRHPTLRICPVKIPPVRRRNVGGRVEFVCRAGFGPAGNLPLNQPARCRQLVPPKRYILPATTVAQFPKRFVISDLGSKVLA
jgi:hypothetical protein